MRAPTANTGLRTGLAPDFAIDGFKLDVEAAKNRWNGEYVLDYWGPQLYVTARF